MGPWGSGQAPVGLLQDHLEHADMEGPVEQVGTGQLVNPELRGRDGLPRRDLGQVKAELLPLGLLVAQGAVPLHCKTKWDWPSLVVPARAPGWAGPGGTWGPGQSGWDRSLLENRLVPALPPGCREGSGSCVVRRPARHLAHGGATRAVSMSGPQAPNPACPAQHPAGSGTHRWGTGQVPPLGRWTSDSRQKRATVAAGT